MCMIACNNQTAPRSTECMMELERMQRRPKTLGKGTILNVQLCVAPLIENQIMLIFYDIKEFKSVKNMSCQN